MQRKIVFAAIHINFWNWITFGNFFGADKHNVCRDAVKEGTGNYAKTTNFTFIALNRSRCYETFECTSKREKSTQNHTVGRFSYIVCTSPDKALSRSVSWINHNTFPLRWWMYTHTHMNGKMTPQWYWVWIKAHTTLRSQQRQRHQHESEPIHANESNQQKQSQAIIIDRSQR